MREPPLKKILYWCERCDLPLIGRTCACGGAVKEIPLVQPYDVRPALAADMALLRELLEERFGCSPLPAIVLLNKGGGIDRNDLVIVHGERFGWLSFDPITRRFEFAVAPGALPYLVGCATRGIVDLDRAMAGSAGKARIGGKRIPVQTDEGEGTVVVRYRGRFGTGVLKDGHIRVKEVRPVQPKTGPSPSWQDAVRANAYHLKNLERSAIRTIRQHMHDRPCANVSFSGGKDSTAVLLLARKAGVEQAFFIDTGIEFPETVEYVKRQGVPIIEKGGDFWTAVEKAGPPGKDHRWCCKLLKLHPLKRYLATAGPCVTIQGNRWYESWNRAALEVVSQNPNNPLQVNISPIRNWRALEVYLYLWWVGAEINPLYERGLERIGCYVCPAMLESEYEELKRLHPEVAARWEEFLGRWTAERGLPEEYRTWGLWRWKELPPKMQKVCRARGIDLAERPREKAAAVAEPPPTAPKGNLDAIRSDFPLLADLVYLDSAATSLSPEPVLAALIEYEHRYRANVGRGVHRLARIATQRYWHAHEKVARFIRGEKGTTVFVKNTTEAIQTVARGLPWQRGDRVVATILEHHSNLLPWMDLRRQGVDLEVVGITPDYALDLAALDAAITEGTRLVAVSHASNVLGTLTPVAEIARICRERGALLLVDGAQTVPHRPIDVQEIGCDFFCFSGHKMCGPTGTGVLWMREAVLAPLMVGGGSVESVTLESYTLAEGYQRYEGGTPNIGGGIALGAAVDYLQGIGMERIRVHDDRLTERLIAGLSRLPRVRVYVPTDPRLRTPLVSFTVEGLEPHEVAHILDEEADIMVRSGHHCNMPLMQHLGLASGTVRASLALYNTEADVDLLLATLDAVVRGL
ncbi:MAG: aminotransferase class V-fold PLP-dependent enzyme [Methanomicrobiales archaeon]|nr:aminotransferase class V-fold PLP-dependent enzyme [Methanomicrobiales archaeon]MDI6876092.1 aminotransferase class V-fold PLP-dependent enzyme [Methanomicrobiales archaeon]